MKFNEWLNIRENQSGLSSEVLRGLAMMFRDAHRFGDKRKMKIAGQEAANILHHTDNNPNITEEDKYKIRVQILKIVNEFSPADSLPNSMIRKGEVADRMLVPPTP